MFSGKQWKELIGPIREMKTVAKGHSFYLVERGGKKLWFISLIYDLYILYMIYNIKCTWFLSLIIFLKTLFVLFNCKILKSTLPISMENEGIIVVQFLCHKFILLRPLVRNVVAKTTSEDDLVCIVDITANLK